MADANPQKQAAPNPASGAPKLERTRVPMSTPQRKLEVPDMPGFFLYWFRSENVGRALQAGYDYVKTTEVNLNPTSIGASREISGSTDSGSNVTLVNGTDEHGNAIIAVLMKLPMDLRNQDLMKMEENNARKISGIFRGEPIGSSGDQSHRYVHTAVMNRPVRKIAKAGPR